MSYLAGEVNVSFMAFLTTDLAKSKELILAPNNALARGLRVWGQQYRLGIHLRTYSLPNQTNRCIVSLVVGNLVKGLVPENQDNSLPLTLSYMGCK